MPIIRSVPETEGSSGQSMCLACTSTGFDLFHQTKKKKKASSAFFFSRITFQETTCNSYYRNKRVISLRLSSQPCLENAVPGWLIWTLYIWRSKVLQAVCVKSSRTNQLTHVTAGETAEWSRAAAWVSWEQGALLCLSLALCLLASRLYFWIWALFPSIKKELDYL